MKLRGLAALPPPSPRSPGGRALALAFAVAAMVAAAAPARAQGTVAGKVSLAPETQRGAPPVRTRGFVPRAPHPMKQARAYDPRPYLIVVLEGGAGANQERAQTIEYPLEGATFTAPIMPVQVGVPFEIVNRSGHAPRLFADGAPDVLAGDPLNPKGTRSATVSTAYRMLPIRDHDSAHIEGAVVAFPHPFFSRVGSDGSFEIGRVPEGTYSARVWYRNGWLDMRPQRVTVSGGERTRVEIDIPPRLEVNVPETGGASE